MAEIDHEILVNYLMESGRRLVVLKMKHGQQKLAGILEPLESKEGVIKISELLERFK